MTNSLKLNIDHPKNLITNLNFNSDHTIKIGTSCTLRYTIICGLFFLMACQSNEKVDETIEGDLYYNWLKLGSFYGQPDSVYQQYEKLMHTADSAAYNGTIEVSHIEFLKKHNLLKSPFIYLKTNVDSICLVYMTYQDYKPITTFKYRDLIKTNKKVRLKLIVNKLSPRHFRCKKVEKIEKMDGQTFQKPRKFRIEDYK